jgi:hypothetical protein
MFEIAAEHSAALVAGILSFPVATAFVMWSPRHRQSPFTARAACVLMIVTGVIHLALIPSHLPAEAFTAALFLANGIGFVALAAIPSWRWWRVASGTWLVMTIVGYLVYAAAGLEAPDQVGLVTKLVELTALGLVAVPSREERRRVDGAARWSMIAAGLPLLTVISTASIWIVDLAHPDAQHVHAGAVLQSTNAVATPEQEAAAARLYAETAAAIAPYQDWRVAWAAGYRPGGSSSMPSTHWMNDAYVKAGYILDPRHAQGLVYANSHHGPVLLGAMFQMPHLGQFGPDPGGPLTAWHQHENICFTPLGLEFSLMTPFATCPVGAIDISAPPMLHVWIVNNPAGPFAVDIDPKVVAEIDRS